MLTRSSAGWRSQYDRMWRSYRRLQVPVPSSGDSSVAYDDDVAHFFMDCWHLKDWIKHDSTLSNPLKSTVESEVTAHQSLQIAADLANGWKHLVRRADRVGADVTKKDVTWELGTKVVVVRHEIELNDGSVHNLQDIALAAVNAWDSILGKHGLL